MSKFLKTLCVGLALGFGGMAVTQPAYAKSDEIYTSWRNNMAVGGYDVVSFHQGNPIKGETKLVTSWRGADWHFANQANLDSFLKEPEKYAPAYGGHCAWAIANGKLAKGSPKNWTLKDGRLFLNFNDKIQNRWNADQAGFITKADAMWPDILK